VKIVYAKANSSQKFALMDDDNGAYNHDEHEEVGEEDNDQYVNNNTNYHIISIFL